MSVFVANIQLIFAVKYNAFTFSAVQKAANELKSLIVSVGQNLSTPDLRQLQTVWRLSKPAVQSRLKRVGARRLLA